MNVFKEELNVAVFTTQFVIRNGEPILNVFHHKDDGAWEFTGATQAVEDKDYLVISLQKIINLDPSVLELADLQLGEAAYRASQDATWEKYVL